MSAAIDALKQAWRDYVTDGVPASGENEPDKSEIRAGLDLLDTLIATVTAGIEHYTSFGSLPAEADAGTLALVTGDTYYEYDELYGWIEATWYIDLLKGDDGLMTATTAAEVDAGTVNDEAVTPLALAESALIRSLAGLGVTDVSAAYVRGQPDISTPGTLASHTGDVIIHDAAPVTTACETLRVQINAEAAGPVWLYVHTRSGNDMTMVERRVVYVTAGENDFLVEMDVPAGAYLGWAGRFILQTMTGGEDVAVYSGGSLASPDYTDATTSTSIRWAISLTAFAGRGAAGVLETRVGHTLPVGENVVIGNTEFDTVSGVQTTTPFRVINRPFVNGGWIETVDVNLSEAGAITIYSYTVDESGDWTPTGSKNLAGLSSGLNEDVPVGLEIPPGGYCGVYTAGIVNRQAGNWLELGFGGDSAAFNDATPGTSAMLLLAWNVIEFRTGSLEFLRSALDADGGGSFAASAARPPRVASEYLEPAILHFPGMGQSTWIGSPSGDQYNTRQEYGALSFNGHNYTDVEITPPVAADPALLADEPVGGRDAPLMGFSAYARTRIMAEGGPSNVAGDVPMIVGHAGHGNTPSSEYVKGATGSDPDFVEAGGWYQMMMDQLTSSIAYADTDPFTVGGLLYYQGQNDAFEADSGTIETLRATVAARMIDIASDFNADVQAELSDTTGRFMYMMQVTSHVNRAANTEITAGWEVAMAHLEASHPATSRVCVAAPEYAVAADDGFEDYQHPAPLGGDRIGALMARAALTGRKWEPLQVVDSYASGDWIVLVYNRDDLVLDIDSMPLQPNYGFRVFDGTMSEVTALDISVSGNRVTIDCGEAADGFSWSYGNITSTGLSPYTGGAGNLRDSAGDTDIWEGWPMHNWAVLQEDTLEVVS